MCFQKAGRVCEDELGKILLKYNAIFFWIGNFRGNDRKASVTIKIINQTIIVDCINCSACL